MHAWRTTELAPGLTLMHNPRLGAAGPAPPATLAAYPGASVEWLTLELARTETAARHLARSNAELAAAAAPGGEWEGDAEVLQALCENDVVLGRQQARIHALRRAIQTLNEHAQPHTLPATAPTETATSPGPTSGGVSSGVETETNLSPHAPTTRTGREGPVAAFLHAAASAPGPTTATAEAQAERDGDGGVYL
jgi:hypothetical protein